MITRRDLFRAAVVGSIAATVGTVAAEAQGDDPLDALTFAYNNDTGWPYAYSGQAFDPVKEWEFHTARNCDIHPLYIIVAYHRPNGEFQRLAWPTDVNGEVVPLDRPPTMCELKTFAAVCLAGLNEPMVPGTPIRTDRMRADVVPLRRVLAGITRDGRELTDDDILALMA